MTTGWGYFTQGADQQIEVDELGSKLSEVLDCAVHYPAYGKHMFECLCGVIFPIYLVKGQNWELIKRKHIEEQRYAMEV
ncbi:hypothetical protein LCGC14_0392960 [marine sediment metagenome]|uniref:Uncharacterized protein n=1 Tax=marine sediment metagenome TaxID=412755 RepID=A0A0F9SZ32_9ZZZZ